ncbi:MAG: hypothetical protein PHY02_08330 [Phycisphaerae bacterium]|nr:hypothetical protein [Phycisphaerae bacterium]
MVFWIGILVSGAFAWLAIKLRFYQTWVLVFNIIISIYLGIYLRPAIANIPAVGDTPYSNILAMAAIVLVSFLVLHCISYVFLTGQFNVPFPKVFDTLGSGFLGFLAGFLVWSFLTLLIYITPASQNSLVKSIGFTDQFRQTGVSYIAGFCNLVNAIVSYDKGDSTEQTINELLKEGAKPKAQPKTPEPKPVTPAKPAEANNIPEQNEPGPPPEEDI